MSGMYCGGHGESLPCGACAKNRARREARDAATHTPGPWQLLRMEGYARDYDYRIRVEGEVITGTIAQLLDWEIRPETEAQQYKNAVLMVSSPDLLEVLQSLKARMEECAAIPSCSASEAYDSFYREMIDAVIAKATGVAT